MLANSPISWPNLLPLVARRSWLWSSSTVIVLIPFLFGGLSGYLAIAEYVAAHGWTVYALLSLPFLCLVLVGALKVIGDELLQISREISAKEPDTIPRPLYKRLKMLAERQFRLDGLVVTYNQVEIEAIADVPIPSVRHRRSAVEEAVSFKEADLQFEARYRNGMGDMKARILNITDNLITWLVEFTPPLTKGQRATYAYRQSSKDTFPVTLEQIYEELAANKRDTDFAYWRFLVVAPTDELHMKIEFPPEYHIRLPFGGGYNVYLGTAEDSWEKNRLKTERCFSATLDPLSKCWTIELLIKHAQMGLTYTLEWIPPTRSEVQALLKAAQ